MQIQKPELVNALATVLSDSVVLAHKAQGAHWNVVGPDFHQYHEFFAEIYGDIDGSIDATAENIRKLGADAPSRLFEFARMANVDDESTTGTSCQELASDLHAGIEIALADIDAAFQIANTVNEQGIANFLAERDDMLKKWRWQLASSLYGHDKASYESYEG